MLEGLSVLCMLMEQKLRAEGFEIDFPDHLFRSIVIRISRLRICISRCRLAFPII